MEDSMIVELYWQRDENAVYETQLKYERYLLTVSNNILSDMEDSKETVNETYLHAWNSMPPHRPSLLSAFLAKIARRLSIDMLRRKTADKRGGGEYALSLQELAESGFEAGYDPEFTSEAEASDLASLINSFLKSKSREKRAVFVLRYFHNYPLDEICSRTGFSLSKVKTILMRMRYELKDYLKEEGYE